MASQRRPSSDSFALQDDEQGISLYRLRMCSPAEVLADAPEPGYGLVQIRRDSLPAAIHVVPTHPDIQPNVTLRMSHVELRYPTPEGGRDYTDSMKKAMARACAYDNVLIAPAER